MIEKKKKGKSKLWFKLRNYFLQTSKQGKNYSKKQSWITILA